MSEPKDEVTTSNFKGFSNTSCEFFPCHKDIKREFSCLFCYCPLYFLECPGPYETYVDRYGTRRKDCTNCTLNHDGYEQSWNMIQKWMENPRHWDPSNPKSRKQMIQDMKERTYL